RHFDPKRAHRTPATESQRTRHLYPERFNARSRSEVARTRLQYHLFDRPRRRALQVSESEHVDSVRSSHEPTRSAGLRRTTLPGRGYANWASRLCDLLRLALSGSDETVGSEWRRGINSCLSLHGSMGRD